MSFVYEDYAMQMLAARAKLVLQGSVVGQSTRKQRISVYAELFEIFYIQGNASTHS